MPRLFLLTIILAVSLVLLRVAGESPAPTHPSHYIVQSLSLADAQSAVSAVGGTITHELGIIRAVGASLSPAQVARLESRGDIRAVFRDRRVSTASSCGLAAGPTFFDNDKFSWTVTNTGTSTVTIGAISIAWPTVNGALKKIRLDGDDIWKVEAEPPYAQVIDGWHDDVRRRQLAPGQSAELLFEFDNNIDWNEANYTIFIDVEQGCSLEFTPRAMDCRSSGLGYRRFNNNKIEWELPNEGDDAVTIEALSLNWPEMNGKLKKVKLEGATLYDNLRDAPVTTIAGGWSPDIRDRRILPGDADTLEIEFTDDIDVDEQAYSLAVQFSEGCNAEFAPSLAGHDQKVDKKARDTHYVRQVGADRLHANGITGAGVTVAILDTGVWSSGGGKNWLRKDYDGVERVLRTFDAINNVEGDADDAEDENGHGSHVTSIILSSRKARGSGNAPAWNGVAPGVSLVAVKAFDEYGEGTYLDVIRGIDWIVRNKDVYGIRVLNLSLSAPPRSHYWDDPLNQAVMEAWRAGIVVVASAGNTGPSAMSIGVPGNVPYVITVGAMTDNGTPFDPGDDTLATFSAAGPTHEGFVKPEIVAPGGRLLGVMNKKNRIPKQHKDFHDGDAYYYMSGTSQSAAVVSGIAALLLEAEPALTPDQLKCKLMSAARPAVTASGSLALSVFQQGAGLVDAGAALESTNYSCANRGLDVDADLAGTKHFAGRASVDENGNYYLFGLESLAWDGLSHDGFGYLWMNGLLWNDGLLWNNGLLWNDGVIWSNGLLWNDGVLWNNGLLWNDGHDWSDDLGEEMSINAWVEQE